MAPEYGCCRHDGGRQVNIGRVARFVAYYGLLRHMPASTGLFGSFWQRMRFHCCRRLFLACGENVNIERGAYFGGGRTIRIGENSGMGINAIVPRGTTIGANVMMGPDVTIIAQNHRFSRLDVPMNAQGFDVERPVTIGDDVWIGTRVIILPGVTIGAGSILGAGAVIAKDVPERAIVVGNPMRVLRFREQQDASERPLRRDSGPTPASTLERQHLGG